MLDINFGSFIGTRFGELPNSLIDECLRSDMRPTTKGLLYEPGHHRGQRIASYEVARLRNLGDKVFTGVGGGAEKPNWVNEFLREATVELSSSKLQPNWIKQAYILQIGEVASSRRISGKLVVIIGVPVPTFHEGALMPSGTELRNMQIGNISETAARVKRCTGTAPGMQQMYLGALSVLREICS